MTHGKTPEPVVVSENGQGPYQQTVRVGKHQWIADEPVSLGGTDSGPAPMDFLLAALGACTSITLRMYAERKQLPLSGVQVSLTHEKVDIESRGRVDRIFRQIQFTGELTTEQRAALLVIANKCPVYRTLTSEIDIDSALVDDADSQRTT